MPPPLATRNKSFILKVGLALGSGSGSFVLYRSV